MARLPQRVSHHLGVVGFVLNDENLGRHGIVYARVNHRWKNRDQTAPQTTENISSESFVRCSQGEVDF
jgi:hypothetical protein